MGPLDPMGRGRGGIGGEATVADVVGALEAVCEGAAVAVGAAVRAGAAVAVEAPDPEGFVSPQAVRLANARPARQDKMYWTRTMVNLTYKMGR